jgi:CRP-like cAMP-binding protein
LFARSFKPGEVLLSAGQAVTKLLFITRGNFAICDPTSKYDPFLILPENSFYGDFQILKNVPCLYTVTALSGDHFEIQNQFLDGKRQLVAVEASNNSK